MGRKGLYYNSTYGWWDTPNVFSTGGDFMITTDSWALTTVYLWEYDPGPGNDDMLVRHTLITSGIQNLSAILIALSTVRPTKRNSMFGSIIILDQQRSIFTVDSNPKLQTVRTADGLLPGTLMLEFCTKIHFYIGFRDGVDGCKLAK